MSGDADRDALESASHETRSVTQTVRRAFWWFVIMVTVFLASCAVSFFMYLGLVEHYGQVVETASRLNDVRSQSVTLATIGEQKDFIRSEPDQRLLSGLLSRLDDELSEIQVDCGGYFDCTLRLRIASGLTQYADDLLANVEPETASERTVEDNTIMLRRVLNLLDREVAGLGSQVSEYWRLWSTEVLRVYSLWYLGFLVGFAGFLILALFIGGRAFGRIVLELNEIRERAESLFTEPDDRPDGSDTSVTQAHLHEPAVHYSELIPIAESIDRTEYESARRLEEVERNIVLTAELQQERVERLEKERFLQKTKLQMLQMQINPHFLFNTLGLVRRMAESGSTEEAVIGIVQLSHILRYSLQTEQTLVSFEDEWKAMNAYVEIQSLRHEGRIQFELMNRVTDGEYFVPPLILQPVIENSITHGLQGGLVGGRVVVAAQEREGDLTLSIEDNGTGFRELSDEGVSTNAGNKTHIGLNNVRERLEFCYGERHRFEIEELDGSGVRVRIVVPPIGEIEHSEK